MGNSGHKENKPPSFWHIQEEGVPDSASLTPHFFFAHKTLILSRFHLDICFRGSLTLWDAHRLSLDLSKVNMVIVPSLLPVILRNGHRTLSRPMRCPEKSAWGLWKTFLCS